MITMTNMTWRECDESLSSHEGRIVFAWDGDTIFAAMPIYDEGWLFYPTSFGALYGSGKLWEIDVADFPIVNEDTGRSTIKKWMPMISPPKE